MTRLASILGVATVATLVLLSGCEQAVKTDYAKKLEGTWVSVELDRTLPLDQTDPMALTAVKTTVEVMIMAGDKANTGDFKFTIADTEPVTMMKSTIAVSGTITTDAKVIEVTVTGIDPPEAATANAAMLIGAPQKLNYEQADNELKVYSSVLAILLANATIMGVPFTADTKLTFTKQ